MNSEKDTPFFVGYLRMPRKLTTFFLILIPVLFGIGMGTALGLVGVQDPPGTGRFIGGYKVLTGILQNSPYPVLFTLPDAEHPQGRAIPLTGPGKVGALSKAAKALDGQMVDVGGIYVARGGYEIFQVGGKVKIRTTEREDLTPEDMAFKVPAAEPIGAYTLAGEIVDSKCYLGAMRPGIGKVHMACANFCIHGGIPPLFVTYHTDKGAEGDVSIFLMADPDGNAIDPSLLDYTSLGVALQGDVIRQGPLYIMKVRPDGVEVL